jgi:hypothetical protein
VLAPETRAVDRARPHHPPPPRRDPGRPSPPALERPPGGPRLQGPPDPPLQVRLPRRRPPNRPRLPVRQRDAQDRAVRCEEARDGSGTHRRLLPVGDWSARAHRDSDARSAGAPRPPQGRRAQ